MLSSEPLSLICSAHLQAFLLSLTISSLVDDMCSVLSLGPAVTDSNAFLTCIQAGSKDWGFANPWAVPLPSIREI